MASLAVILALAASCGIGDDGTGKSDPGGGGSCTTSIEFKGREYTATDRPAISDGKPGKKLGTAELADCDDSGPGGESTVLTIYSVVGVPVSEAIYAKPRVGVMSVSDFD